MADTLLKDPLPHFVKKLEDGRWLYLIDHHTIATLNDCEIKFKERHIKNLRPKGRRAVLDIGSWWSDVMEEFYNAIGLLQGQGQIPTKQTLLEIAGLCWDQRQMDGLEQADPKKYHTFGGKPGGLLMACEYWDKQAYGDSRAWKIIAAEAGFGAKGEVPLFENDQLVIHYMGKPDLAIFEHASQELLPLDHKSVDKITYDIQRKYKPHPQTAGYIYSFNVIAKKLGIDRPVTRCIINVAARTRPTDKPRDGKIKPRFTRVFPAYSPEEIAEWRWNVIEKVKRLHYCLEHDEWIWRESACHLYAGCEFRGLHSVASASRSIIEKADFVQVEPWVPYKPEEDESEVS